MNANNENISRRTAVPVEVNTQPPRKTMENTTPLEGLFELAEMKCKNIRSIKQLQMHKTLNVTLKVLFRFVFASFCAVAALSIAYLFRLQTLKNDVAWELPMPPPENCSFASIVPVYIPESDVSNKSYVLCWGGFRWLPEFICQDHFVYEQQRCVDDD